MSRLTHMMLLAGSLIVGAACDAASTTSEGVDDDGVRVPVADLLDVDASLPDEAAGVDLGDLGPGDGLTFCEAFAATRSAGSPT